MPNYCDCELFVIGPNDLIDAFEEPLEIQQQIDEHEEMEAKINEREEMKAKFKKLFAEMWHSEVARAEAKQLERVFKEKYYKKSFLDIYLPVPEEPEWEP